MAHHLREGTQLIEVAHTLEAAVDEARVLDVVRKKDIHDGDRVVVTTRNSRYTIWAAGNGLYWVWGGWFDLQGSSPQRMTINGCTWGGSVIERDIRCCTWASIGVWKYRASRRGLKRSMSSEPGRTSIPTNLLVHHPLELA